MKRDIKNTGEYFECDADQILDRLQELSEADVIVIKKARVELAGSDKERFLSTFIAEKNACEVLEEFRQLDNAQKSDYVIRNMVID